METRKSKLTECKINQWSLKNVQRTNEGEKKIGLPRNTHWTVKEDNQINKKKIFICVVKKYLQFQEKLTKFMR